MISVSGVCSTDFKCTITVAGSIQSLLVDGDKYTASSSISAWCDKGRCYGSADIPLTATAPFTITCDQVTGTHACSATISGAANAIFTNDHVPRAHRRKGHDELDETLVRNGASIGANATVVCGNTIGANALVGAGAVVTKDVASHALVVGNPARRIGWVCRCGTRLDDDNDPLDHDGGPIDHVHDLDHGPGR